MRGKLKIRANLPPIEALTFVCHRAPQLACSARSSATDYREEASVSSCKRHRKISKDRSYAKSPPLPLTKLDSGFLENYVVATDDAAIATTAAIVRQQVDRHGMLPKYRDHVLFNKQPRFTEYEVVVADPADATDEVRFLHVKPRKT